MRLVLFAMLVLMLPLSSFSQTGRSSSNWKRLLPDTARTHYVIGPENEFYKMAALSKLRDDVAFNARREFIRLNSTLRTCDSTAARQARHINSIMLDLNDCTEVGRNLTDANIKLSNRLAGMKAWATIGKVTVVVVVVAVLVKGSVMIIEVLQP